MIQAVSYLTGQFQRCDVVLSTGHQMDREEQLRQRRFRLLKDRTGLRRHLLVTALALEEASRCRQTVPLRATRGTHKSILPSHLNERSVALLHAAIAPHELGHAESHLGMHRIGRHLHLPSIVDDAKHINALWPHEE